MSPVRYSKNPNSGNRLMERLKHEVVPRNREQNQQQIFSQSLLSQPFFLM